MQNHIYKVYFDVFCRYIENLESPEEQIALLTNDEQLKANKLCYIIQCVMYVHIGSYIEASLSG